MAAQIQPHNDLLNFRRIPHLFLSHSSKNKELVRKLAQDLNVCEIDVWLDSWEINAGDSLYEKLSTAIEDSKYIALIISEEFNESVWANNELKQAIAREIRIKRKLIIPILIDDAQIPPFLEDRIYVNLSKNYFEGICRISGVIHDLRIRAIDEAIQKYKPEKVGDCIKVLRYTGFEPYIFADKEILDEIMEHGGIPYKENRVRFNPEALLEIEGLSLRTKVFLRRSIEVWR